MKAIAAVCATGASVPTISSGRVHRHRDGENAEIKMYLSKLQDLVPFMPKDRKISKLEVIQHVIDYICELQSALETHPAVGAFDAAAALESANPSEWTTRSPHRASSPRQPLGVLSAPNTILLASPAPSVVPHHTDSSSHHHTIPDKISTQQERPTSC